MPFDKTTREVVLSRDSYKCRVDDSTEGVEAHHIIPESNGGPNTVQNGISLCHKCHAKAHVRVCYTKIIETSRVIIKRETIYADDSPNHNRDCQFSDGRCDVREWIKEDSKTMREDFKLYRFRCTGGHWMKCPEYLRLSEKWKCTNQEEFFKTLEMDYLPDLTPEEKAERIKFIHNFVEQQEMSI